MWKANRSAVVLSPLEWHLQPKLISRLRLRDLEKAQAQCNIHLIVMITKLLSYTANFKVHTVYIYYFRSLYYSTSKLNYISEEGWHNISTNNFYSNYTYKIPVLEWLERVGWTGCFMKEDSYIISSFLFSSTGWICFNPCTSIHAQQAHVTCYVIVFEHDWLGLIAPLHELSLKWTIN